MITGGCETARLLHRVLKVHLDERHPSEINHRAMTKKKNRGATRANSSIVWPFVAPSLKDRLIGGRCIFAAPDAHLAYRQTSLELS
jgi:hypothetical protein